MTMHLKSATIKNKSLLCWMLAGMSNLSQGSSLGLSTNHNLLPMNHQGLNSDHILGHDGTVQFTNELMGMTKMEEQ